MVKRYRNLLSFLILASFVAIGCDPAAVFAPRRPEPRDGEMQTERDPMHPREKMQTGYHYDKKEWVDGHYEPDTLGGAITSQGRSGVSRMTFTESGGDYNVNVSADGTRMIYCTTKWSRNPQIAIQGVTSKAVRRLTDHHNMGDMMPRFHPKAAEVAWASDRAGNWDIWITHIGDQENSAPQQLTRSTDDEQHPTYSPDGKLIAFCRFNSQDGQWQIWVIDIENRVVSSITDGYLPEFRPVVEKGDKNRPKYTLAYQRHRQRDVPFYSVWTVDIQMSDDGSVNAVSSPTEIVSSHEWAAITPAWSPDGNYLCFATVRKSVLAQYQARINKADDIWVVRRDGTDLTQITSHSAPDWDPFWAVDPNDPAGPGRIYFSSEREGQANIWSVKPVIATLLVKAAPKANPAGDGQ